MYYGTVLLYLTVLPFCIPQPDEVVDQHAANYLKRFGYMPVLKPGMQAHNLATELYYADPEAYSKAIKKFQTFAKLPITGKFDSKTKEKMMQPRCGVEDFDGLQRDAVDLKWKKAEISWILESAPQQLHKSESRRILYDSFSAWEKVIPLRFQELTSNSKADIGINFVKRFHEGDHNPFDGPGGILAHAFPPTDGRVHFDEEEDWSLPEDNSQQKTDLLSVAIHEIGHSLGLSHATESNAVMAPFYRKVAKTRSGNMLHQDDVRRIQALYGQKETEHHGNLGFGSSRFGRRRRVLPFIPQIPKPNPNPTPNPTPPPTTTSRPTLSPSNQPTFPAKCKDIRAALLNLDKSLLVFLRNGSTKIVKNGVLQDIDVRKLFPDLPKSITAVVAIKRTNRILFFTGRTMWAYNRNANGTFALDPSFPKDLSSSIFTPKYAFIWKDGHTVLTDNNLFCTFDENWNKCTMTNKLQKYFNIPNNINTSFESPANPQNVILISPNGFLEYDMRFDSTESFDHNHILQC